MLRFSRQPGLNDFVVGVKIENAPVISATGVKIENAPVLSATGVKIENAPVISATGVTIENPKSKIANRSMVVVSEIAGRIATLGVFGGTFDPVHYGHLILAERAREQLGLDAVLFIPAHEPPHKLGERGISSGRARMDMLNIATASNPAFHTSSIELDRAGISYTVDTLTYLRDDFPDVRLTLLIGEDNLLGFSGWHRPKEILNLAHLAVWRRPGERKDLPDDIPFDFTVVDAPLIQISGTEIRSRIASGKSIRYLTPDPVLEYIDRHGLYR